MSITKALAVWTNHIRATGRKPT